ncbi:hypothetical protein [Pseudanabaena minima]
MHEKLMLYGIRYRPNYKIAIAKILQSYFGNFSSMSNCFNLI